MHSQQGYARCFISTFQATDVESKPTQPIYTDNLFPCPPPPNQYNYNWNSSLIGKVNIKWPAHITRATITEQD